jgi:hypothetical protein
MHRTNRIGYGIAVICSTLAVGACGSKKDGAAGDKSSPASASGAGSASASAKPEPVPPSAAAKPAEPTHAAAPPAPTPDAAPAPTAAPAPDPVACGSAGVAGGGAVPFCIRLPDGYKAAGKPTKPDNWTTLDYVKKDSVDLNTEWTDGPGGYDNLVDILKGDGSADGHKLVASGPTAGGGGFFVIYDGTPGTAGDHQLWTEAVYKGSKTLIKCGTSWWTNQPSGPAAADACKSLTPQ